MSPQFGNLTVTPAAQKITATFSPRYAILSGTVDPATATVTVNGTPVSVIDGTFLQLLTEGIYPFSVTAPGFQTDNGTIIMTPGNTTALPVKLTAVVATPGPNSGSTTSSGGLTVTEDVALAAIAVAAAAVVGGR